MSNVTDPQPTAAAAPGGRLLLSGLLRRDALDGAGQGLGRVIDVIVRLREDDYPAVTGLVASIGGRHLFVPATEIVTWDSRHIELASARLDLRPFERRVGEVLLHGDVLGHRLVDIERVRPDQGRLDREGGRHRPPRPAASPEGAHVAGLVRIRGTHRPRWIGAVAPEAREVASTQASPVGGHHRPIP